MKQIYKKIIFFLLMSCFIFVPENALAANVKLPININVSGSNPIYYRYDLSVSKLDSHDNIVSNTIVPLFLQRNGTLIYDFGDFDDVGEYKYNISLSNTDNEKFEFDKRNYIVHIQALTNGYDIYTNTYLEDPLEAAKPAALDFNVKYLVEIKYPNGKNNKNDGSDSRGEKKDSSKKDNKESSSKKDNKESSKKDNKDSKKIDKNYGDTNSESEPESNGDIVPVIEIDDPSNVSSINEEDKGTMIDIAKKIKKAIVRTGDESTLEFYIILFFISICTFILLFFRRKKNHR